MWKDWVRPYGKPFFDHTTKELSSIPRFGQDQIMQFLINLKNNGQFKMMKSGSLRGATISGNLIAL